MSSERLLQPLWNYILRDWSNLVSLWFFPSLLGWVVYVGVGVYFMLKDVGPLRSEATRLHKGDADWPTWRKVLYVGGTQIGIYALINAAFWICLPYHVVMPELAPTVWELVRDFCTSMLIGDFLVYLEHIVHHKILFLYKHVHHVHHCFRTDLFSWCAGWVHPFELTVFALCMIIYPWILSPVHPLTLWIYLSVFVALLLEEHSGHDVWWSPNHLIPSVFGGAVPHDVHHVKVKTNYGFVFTIWDRIFGTYLAPVPIESCGDLKSNF